jgi:CysZ protein
LAVAPLALTLLAFGLAATLFVANLDALTTWVRGMFEVAPPENVYGWLWVGPLRFLGWIARWVLLGMFGVGVYVSFTLLGGVLASPFLDALSRRVERLQSGKVIDLAGPGVGGAVSAALKVGWEEAKRAAFFFGVQGTLLVLSLIPGLQVVTFPLALGFAIFFLPLDYAGYALDRRETPFRDRRRWIRTNWGAVGGFGAAALVTFGLPGLNFLALPWLATAATLLVLDHEP